MTRTRPESGWHSMALATALFAITLNFLQPLAHAALMRDGGPTAASLWMSMCLPDSGQDGQQGSMPAAGKLHECCLGLAHAPSLAVPSTAFAVVERPVSVVDRPHLAVDAIAPVGIRDGPSQARAPPSFV